MPLSPGSVQLCPHQFTVPTPYSETTVNLIDGSGAQAFGELELEHDDALNDWLVLLLLVEPAELELDPHVLQSAYTPETSPGTLVGVSGVRWSK